MQPHNPFGIESRGNVVTRRRVLEFHLEFDAALAGALDSHLAELIAGAQSPEPLFRSIEQRKVVAQDVRG